MILSPRFYEPIEIDRAAERRKLGLDPERKTGLVMFGGQGSNVMVEIAGASTRSSSASAGRMTSWRRNCAR